MKKTQPRGGKKLLTSSKKPSDEELKRAMPEMHALAEFVLEIYQEKQKNKKRKLLDSIQKARK